MNMREQVAGIVSDDNVIRLFNLYTHTDVSERLCNALIDAGYDLDEIGLDEFDEVMDALLDLNVHIEAD